MILAELSTDRLIDENELAAMNPVRIDDASALIGAILRQRIKDLCLCARGSKSAEWLNPKSISRDAAAWLREVGATTGDVNEVGDLILQIVREKVSANG